MSRCVNCGQDDDRDEARTGDGVAHHRLRPPALRALCPLLSSYAALCNGPVTGATAASRGETRPPPRPHLPAGACRLAVRGPLLRVVAATPHPAVGPRASAAPLLGRGRGRRDLALSAPGPALHTEHHARDFSFEGKSIPLTVFIVEQNTGAKDQGQHADGTPTAVTTSDQQMAPSAPDSRRMKTPRKCVTHNLCYS